MKVSRLLCLMQLRIIVIKHPLFKASARATNYDPDNVQWETLDTIKKGSACFFNDEEKARMREYLVSEFNPFKIKQIQSISLPVIRPILEEAGVDYSNDIVPDDNAVQAHGIIDRMVVKIGEIEEQV